MGKKTQKQAHVTAQLDGKGQARGGAKVTQEKMLPFWEMSDGGEGSLGRKQKRDMTREKKERRRRGKVSQARGGEKRGTGLLDQKNPKKEGAGGCKGVVVVAGGGGFWGGKGGVVGGGWGGEPRTPLVNKRFRVPPGIVNPRRFNLPPIPGTCKLPPHLHHSTTPRGRRVEKNPRNSHSPKQPRKRTPQKVRKGNVALG